MRHNSPTNKERNKGRKRGFISSARHATRTEVGGCNKMPEKQRGTSAGRDPEGCVGGGNTTSCTLRLCRPQVMRRDLLHGSSIGGG